MLCYTYYVTLCVYMCMYIYIYSTVSILYHIMIYYIILYYIILYYIILYYIILYYITSGERTERPGPGLLGRSRWIVAGVFFVQSGLRFC